MYKILLVDDDNDEQELFREALEEMELPLEFTTAFNGEAALSMLAANRDDLPDYIFLDLNMPRMNGKECLAALKKDALFQQIPVVIYTTSYNEKDQEETTTMGALLFLTKPTSIAELKSQINSVLLLK